MENATGVLVLVAVLAAGAAAGVPLDAAFAAEIPLVILRVFCG